MIPSLAPAFASPFHWYSAHFRLADSCGPAAGAVPPLDMNGIWPAIDRFSQPFGSADPRAVVSLWSQYYFAALIVPTVAVAVRLRRHLPVAAHRVRFLPAVDGTPATFLLADDGAASGSAPDAAIGELCDDHLAPFIEALAEACGVTQRLLWSNAATILEWALRQASADDALSRAAVECGLARFAELAGPNGVRNPLFRPVQYIDEPGSVVRRRRVCCLRYLIPSEDHCGSLCPLPEVRKA